MNTKDDPTDPDLRQAISDLATGTKTPAEAGPAVQKMFRDAVTLLNTDGLTEDLFRKRVVNNYGAAMAIVTADGHDLLVVADRTMQSLRLGGVQVAMLSSLFGDAVKMASDSLSEANAWPKMRPRHDPSYG